MNLNTSPITTGGWINVLPTPVYHRAAAPKTKRPCYMDGQMSQHFSPFVSEALAAAASRHDIAAIDQLTDALVVDGLARPRGDISRLDALREAAARRYGARK